MTDKYISQLNHYISVMNERNIKTAENANKLDEFLAEWREDMSACSLCLFMEIKRLREIENMVKEVMKCD